MSRLVDRMQDARWMPPSFAFRKDDDRWNGMIWDQTQRLRGFLTEQVRTVPLLMIDNVAEYLYAGTDQEVWDMKADFPNLAPPFPAFFAEWNMPSRMVSRETGVKKLNGRQTVGFWCEGKSVDDMIADGTHSADLRHRPTEETGAPIGWAFTATLIREDRRGEIIAPVGKIDYWIDQQGRMLGQHTMALVGIHKDDPNIEAVRSYVHAHIFPLCLAKSFMHCRNVAMRESGPDAKLSKAHQKRHGKPLYRYHILEIEALKETLRREGGSETTGLKKALHICRGHFAHYEDRGLFGKYKGTFWRPSHVRGSIKEGVVAADYAVKR